MKILLATNGPRHSRNVVDLLKRIPFASPRNEVSVLVVVPNAKLPLQIALRRDGENLARGAAQR